MPNVLEFRDYRLFLKAELELSIKKNKSYSLRAFAKRCRLSPSYLSRVLNGQRKLSASHASRVSQALGLDPEESSHFFALLGNNFVETDKSQPTSQFLSAEVFQAIAEWHHFAILALAKTRGFSADPQWIAARIGISPTSAKLAVERLLRLGLLIKVGKTYKSANDAQLETPHDVSSVAVRENHRQHLEGAALALQTVDVSLREYSNTSISMNLSDLPAAKKRLRSFMDRFIRDFEVDRSEEVMQLNLQLYPLTKIERGRA